MRLLVHKRLQLIAFTLFLICRKPMFISHIWRGFPGTTSYHYHKPLNHFSTICCIIQMELEFCASWFYAEFHALFQSWKKKLLISTHSLSLSPSPQSSNIKQSFYSFERIYQNEIQFQVSMRLLKSFQSAC